MRKMRSMSSLYSSDSVESPVVQPRTFIKTALLQPSDVEVPVDQLVSRPLTPSPESKSKIIEDAWIPLSDGVRLSARIWMPNQCLNGNKCPAILEIIPYGKRHGTSYRDETNYSVLSEHGFVCIRVDCRGCGDSEGILEDEYTEREFLDIEECIQWIATQPWCSGRVGMTGLSWGGFNSLQVAVRNPPNLYGIMAHCCSDDRYNVDVHYSGGCLLADNISWGAFMLTFIAGPPDPALVGDKWLDMWKQRLETTKPWLHEWMRHQAYDDYWKRGSIKECYEKLNVPTYIVSGWADGYNAAVSTILANANPSDGAVVRGMNGPWAHTYPHTGNPGPSVDYLSEMIRWWKYCLSDNEEMKQDYLERPAYVAYIQERDEPNIIVDQRTGRWVSEEEWPSPNINDYTLYFTHDKKLTSNIAEVGARLFPKLKSGLSLGVDCGRLGYGKDPDFPVDQRQEDAHSLCFDSKVLEERIEVLGELKAVLSLKCNKPYGMVAVRVCDVDPRTGSSLLVTFGVLNLTHMRGHEKPECVDNGKLNRNVEVSCGHIGYAFKPGNIIRVAISTSLWPCVWTAKEPFCIQLTSGPSHVAGSRLILPRRKPRLTESDIKKDFPLVPALYRNPRKIKTGKYTELRPQQIGTRNLMNNYVTGEKTLELSKDYGLVRDEDNGIEHDEWTRELYKVLDPKHSNSEPDPLSNEMQVDYYIEIGRSAERNQKLLEAGRSLYNSTEDWRVRVQTATRVTCDKDNFHVHSKLEALQYHTINGLKETKVILKNEWKEAIPRKYV